MMVPPPRPACTGNANALRQQPAEAAVADYRDFHRSLLERSHDSIFRSAGKKAKNFRPVIDQVAAVEILNTWLDSTLG